MGGDDEGENANWTVPSFRIPLDVDIIHHPNEKLSKSTAVDHEYLFTTTVHMLCTLTANQYHYFLKLDSIPNRLPRCMVVFYALVK